MTKSPKAAKPDCEISFPTTPPLILSFYLDSLDAKTAGPGRYITEIDDLVGGQIKFGKPKPVFVGETLGFLMAMWNAVLAASLRRAKTSVGDDNFSILFSPVPNGIDVAFTSKGTTLHSEHFDAARMADWIHSSCLEIIGAIAKQLNVVALPPTLDACMLMTQACSRKR